MFETVAGFFGRPFPVGSGLKNKLTRRYMPLIVLLLLISGNLLALPGMLQYYSHILSAKDIPPEHVQAAAYLVVIITNVIFVLGLLLTWAWIAVTLRFAAGLSLEQKINWGALLAIAVRSYLPMAVGNLLTGLLVNFSPPSLAPHVGFHLGVLLPPGDGFFHRLLTHFNPFWIYTLMLAVKGAGEQLSIRAGQAALLLWGTWLFFVLPASLLGISPGFLLDVKYLEIRYIG